MQYSFAPVALLLVSVAGAISCQRAEAQSAVAPGSGAAAPGGTSAELNPRLLRRFSPIRPILTSDPSSITAERVALGRMLFSDKRLSKNHDISCSSCHRLDRYGVDARPTSIGHRGQHGDRNAPTVYNAAAHTAQFWDGRSADVEAQAQRPILDAREMAMSGAASVEKTLKSIPGYNEAFRRAFPDARDPVTFDNLGRAIGAFERVLTTPSRWDAYLAGQKDALTAREKEGLKVFTNIGCMVCHTGEVLGGTSFQKVGAVEAWPNQKDQGRFAVTKVEADRMMFKVPTLRNIAMTGPYFHDGSASTLTEAVRKMGRHQLGLDLEPREVETITAWLTSLTGELPQQYVAEPALPKSSATTPVPDPT